MPSRKAAPPRRVHSNPASLLPATLRSGLVGNTDPLYQTLLLSRIAFAGLGRLIDTKYDIDNECGYPIEWTPYQYRRMYDREAIAYRATTLESDECWSTEPRIYEAEGSKKTAFDDRWQRLSTDMFDLESDSTNIWHYLHRIDELSGIGSYGLLLLGLNDGKDLSEPVDGIDEYGRMTGEHDPDTELLYLRTFDQSLCRVLGFEQDVTNPRYTHPVAYQVRFVDIMQGNPESIMVAGNFFRQIHWSRIIHVADNRKNGEVYGTSRMRPILNRLLDLRKLLGGSAEMFWKGAFPGYTFEINPEFASEQLLDQDDNPEKQRLRHELEAWSRGLERSLPLLGVKATSLAPQVAQPQRHIMEQLRAIALALRCPLRIFLGSEEAKMASSTDKRTWNERMRLRQNKYLTPMLIRPLINRLIAVGVLPKPKQYHVEWPDLNKPTDQDKANLAITRTQALVQYFAAGLYNLIDPKDYLTEFLGMTIERAESLLANSQFKDMKKLAAYLQKPMGAGQVNGNGKPKGGPGGKQNGGGGGGKNKATQAVEESRNVDRGIHMATGGDAI